jgi:hypothetical protein
MFADADFADFSQEIGLASLGECCASLGVMVCTCVDEWRTGAFFITPHRGQRRRYREAGSLLLAFGRVRFVEVSIAATLL